LTSFSNAAPPKRSTVIPGICNNVNAFHTANGLQNGQLVLTYGSNDGQAGARGTQSCPTGFCGPQNLVYTATLGVTDLMTSCDEFPFRSSEEGGRKFYGLYRTGNPTGVQTTCVPIWQVCAQIPSSHHILAQQTINILLTCSL